MSRTILFSKIIASILVLTVAFAAFPNAVYAAVDMASQDTTDLTQNNEFTTPQGTDNPDNTEITRANAEIFCELTENRTEFSKDYLLTNGQQVSVFYPEAVHYDLSGIWEEIDNTLLVNRDGSSISTAKGPFNVTFPQNMGDGAITVTQGKYRISFSLDSQTRKVINSGVLGKESETEVVENVAKVSATINQSTREKQEGIREEVFPTKIYSGLTYRNIFESVDLRYDISPYMLKETIVINSFATTQSGYTFTLDAGDLLPVLQEDGSITLQDKQTQEGVFYIQAPYLMDANEKICRDVVVTLQKVGTGRGNVWSITYSLPMDWMKTAAYPVALDPIIKTDNESNLAIEDIALAETNSDLDTFGYDVMYLRAGKSSYYGRLRSFVKFTSLPELSTGDVITHAEIGLYKAVSDADEMTICVSEITSSWKAQTNGVSLTWANQPTISSTYEDYLLVKNAGYYYWDITDLARQWYETGVNNGVAITAYNESSSTDYKRFYSSDNQGDNPLPILIVYYTNVEGLEDYWDYASVSCGVGGTGYVNLFSGNLIWSHDDLAYGGNLSVAISHVYNSGSANDNDSGLGYGWKTNYNQRVYELKDEGLDTTYYVWEDGDGTKHYFTFDESISKYVDEANTGLTAFIWVEGQNTISGSEITDKQGNTLIFGPKGRLVGIQKNNEKLSRITITYVDNSDENMYKIKTITDPAGRVYTYSYNASTGLLETIYVKSSEGNIFDYIDFYYTSSGKLSRIEYGDGTPNTYFSYSGSTNFLSFINETDTDYAISINYSAGSIKKVTRVLEEINYGERTTSGAQLNFTYAHNQTTMQDRSGHIQILQFNDFGNTICVQDDKGNASYGEYTYNDYDEQTSSTGAERKNQLTISSKLQDTVSNKFSDPTLQNWSTYWGEMAQYTAGSVVTETSNFHTGSESIKMSMAANSSKPSIVYNHKDYIYINPGESYTFSAYVKTEGTNSGAFYLSLSTAYSSQIHSDYVTDTNGDWIRLDVTYTHLGTTQARIYPYLVLNGEGTIFVDSVQLEEGKSASRFNIVQNGDLSSSNTTSGILGWATTGDVSRVDISSAITEGTSAADALDNNVLKMVGNPNGQVHARQELSISGKKNDTFVVSGWAMGDSVQLGRVQKSALERTFGIRVQFLNGSRALVNQCTFSFNPDMDATNEWQYLAGQAVANGDYTYIRITLLYDYNLNTAYFDGIQLYKENFGTVYSYDGFANLNKVTNVQGETTEYIYDDNNDLVSVTLPNKTFYSYSYDQYHNLEWSMTPTGTVYTYVYDDFGNNVEAYVGTESNPKQIGVFSEYAHFGEYLVSVTDEIGNTTEYEYDFNKGRLSAVKYPNDTDSTKTHYDYDSRGRLKSTYKSNGSGGVVEEKNDYSGGMLSTLTHTGQSSSDNTVYTFTYNNLDLVSSVKVGTRTLASYTYNNAYERYLTTLTYGNGGKISYTYDDEGRTASITYDDKDTPSLKYTYDQFGRLILVEDLDANTVITYKYDLTDRLLKYEVKDSDKKKLYAVEYTYNQLNNLHMQKEIVNEISFVSSYSYDWENRLSSITKFNGFSGDIVKQNLNYDSLGRLNNIKILENSISVVNTTLDYKAPNSGTGTITTNVLSQWKNTYGGTTTSYYYKYDANGNIVEISPDSIFSNDNGVRYSYDKLNQLVRVDDKDNGESWTYTYDLGGNIVSKSRYAYTRGTLGTALQTINYGYTDSSWADLLTSYNGKSLTYDQIGNLKSDGTWSYTWEHGRQLAKQSNGTTTWSYSYDATGQRISKTNGILTYQYIYDGIQLKYLKITRDTTTVCEMYFEYGQTGLLAIQYISSSLTDKYYVLTNAQGDVVGLVDGSGALVVKYSYDAWGKLKSMTGSLASTVGTYNPIRYRGYVYDTETQLYYLNTRYYNPDMGRFINADSYASTGDELVGTNMFAYCGNNPVNCYDPSGEIAITTLILIGSAVFALATAAYTAYVEYNAGFSTEEIIVDSFIAGSSAFFLVYSIGMTAYDCYQHYCYLSGLAPITEIGGNTNVSVQVQTYGNTSRGSTGRTEPSNLREQLAMEQVKSNPSAGTQLKKIQMEDSRWPSSEGWVKMQQIVPTYRGDINIHYVYNQILKIYDDFKFKQ